MSKRLNPVEYMRLELLDRLFMLAEMVDNYLLEHPSMTGDPEMEGEAFSEADKDHIRNYIDTASGLLWEAYQRVGEIHL